MQDAKRDEDIFSMLYIYFGSFNCTKEYFISLM